VEFVLATLKIALNGRNLTFLLLLIIGIWCRKSLDSAASPTFGHLDLRASLSRGTKLGDLQNKEWFVALN
jgi:hypothetical protein